VALARKGYWACIFDADTGLAHINLLLDSHPRIHAGARPQRGATHRTAPYRSNRCANLYVHTTRYF
jgi:hypothetical protein